MFTNKFTRSFRAVGIAGLFSELDKTVVVKVVQHGCTDDYRVA